MEIILLILRLLLAATFIVAGVAKLTDLASSRQAIRDFGIPNDVATPLGTLLPFAELIIGVALLPASTAWWGALGAFILVLLFIVGISVNLARGRQPDCHCFGQLHSEPISWKTLLRNGLLAVFAAFVLVQGRNNPGPGAFDWIVALSSVEIISLIVTVIVLCIAAVETWFLLHVLQQQGRMLVRIEALEAQLMSNGVFSSTPQSEMSPAGLPIGTSAPPFELPDLAGKTLTLTKLLSHEKPVMLLFSDPGCEPCNLLMPDVARWQRDYATELTIDIISRGTVEDNRIKSEKFGLTNVLLQQDWEVAKAYENYGTPGAVLIHPDGTIGSPLAMGAEGIQALVQNTIGAEVAVQLSE